MTRAQSTTEPRILFVAGSTSEKSRSRHVLGSLERSCRGHSRPTRLYSVRDFPAEALIEGDAREKAIAAFIADVKSARAVVFATPVYKATYAGALKLLLDVIPPDALAGKAALAVATARQAAHFATVERGFRDVFEFFQIARTLTPVWLVDEQIKLDGPAGGLDSAAQAALERALAELCAVA